MVADLAVWLVQETVMAIATDALLRRPHTSAAHAQAHPRQPRGAQGGEEGGVDDLPPPMYPGKIWEGEGGACLCMVNTAAGLQAVGMRLA